MTRRALLAAPSLFAQPSPPPRRPPNVILIMTDDQGFGDLSAHGNTRLHTPYLDRLAKESTEFSRFTVCPVCAPTRASLLTGRYNLRTGVHGVTHGRETIRAEEVTLGKALQAAGYRTALIGKWHLGENYPSVPHAMGFDEFIGFRPGHWNRYFDSPAERNGKPVKLRGYITDAFTDEAIRFVTENRSRPFFLYLAYNTPHAPYQVPDEYFDRYKDAGSPELAAIYGMIANIDDNVGRLLNKLEWLKLAEDTIVIFLCDNGPQTNRFNAGLRLRKGSIYEGGTRAPFFLRWPGKVKSGMKINIPAAHIDVYPTVLDLCGVRRPEGPALDGVSLRPILEGSPGPDRVLFSHADHQDPLRKFPGAARGRRFKMVNGEELYDLEADPGESSNVAADHPEELRRLNALYDEWYASVTRGFQARRRPIPVGYREENPAILFAPQARMEGGVHFHSRNGFANDFLAGWEKPDAKASWEISVTEGGRYEILIEYLAAEGGGKISAAVGRESAEGEAEAGSLDPNPLPERSPQRTASTAPDLNWKMLRLGRMPIEAGPAVLEVTGKMTYLKSVHVRRIR